MRRIITLLIVALIGLLATPLLLQKPSGERPPLKNLPWRIEFPISGGSRVFGLTLGESTLGEARERFGQDMQVAVMEGIRHGDALEAYFDKFTAGVITGKLVLGTDVDPAWLERLRLGAIKTERVSSGTHKFVPNPDDLPIALRAEITTITFIPSANLDQEIVLKRFGEPAERVRNDPAVEHFLYPEKGLALSLNQDGKEVLQYVAPREFQRLRDLLGAP